MRIVVKLKKYFGLTLEAENIFVYLYKYIILLHSEISFNADNNIMYIEFTVKGFDCASNFTK